MEHNTLFYIIFIFNKAQYFIFRSPQWLLPSFLHSSYSLGKADTITITITMVISPSPSPSPSQLPSQWGYHHHHHHVFCFTMFLQGTISYYWSLLHYPPQHTAAHLAKPQHAGARNNLHLHTITHTNTPTPDTNTRPMHTHAQQRNATRD